MEEQLQRYLHEQIPLTQAMGLKVLVASPERILLGCPLRENINHHGTAFGGSISALATLTGWCWLYIMMRERAVMPKLMVSSSSIDYLTPVEDFFTAELRPPKDEDILAFSTSFDRRGSGRIELKVEVLCQGEEVAHFTGSYVAIRS